MGQEEKKEVTVEFEFEFVALDEMNAKANKLVETLKEANKLVAELEKGCKLVVELQDEHKLANVVIARINSILEDQIARNATA